MGRGRDAEARLGPDRAGGPAACAGRRPGRGVPWGRAGRAGGLVRGLVGEVGGDGVLLNAVCPGPTPPDRPPTAPEGFTTPESSTTSPEDIARALVFLCSAANGAITGETLTLAGRR
ncbi:SDR family oxidoreductase [Streptomyces indonesiensis]